ACWLPSVSLASPPKLRQPPSTTARGASSSSRREASVTAPIVTVCRSSTDTSATTAVWSTCQAKFTRTAPFPCLCRRAPRGPTARAGSPAIQETAAGTACQARTGAPAIGRPTGAGKVGGCAALIAAQFGPMVACHRGHCLWFAGDGIEIEGWTLRPTAFRSPRPLPFLNGSECPGASHSCSGELGCKRCGRRRPGGGFAPWPVAGCRRRLCADEKESQGQANPEGSAAHAIHARGTERRGHSRHSRCPGVGGFGGLPAPIAGGQRALAGAVWGRCRRRLRRRPAHGLVAIWQSPRIQRGDRRQHRRADRSLCLSRPGL